MDWFESYLGLPTLIGRSKNQAFFYLKDIFWKKIQGRKGQLLSRASKEVLIKAVAQLIPTYTTGVFQLPRKLYDDLNAMCARFWWGRCVVKEKYIGKVGRPYLNQKRKVA